MVTLPRIPRAVPKGFRLRSQHEDAIKQRAKRAAHRELKGLK